MQYWLKGAASHIVANEWRYRRTQSRDSRLEVRMDALPPGPRDRIEPRHLGTAELAYDRAKVHACLGAVRQRLHDEYAACGKVELFETLSCYLPGLRQEQPLYRSQAADLGIEVNTLKQRVNRFHDKYLQCFRHELRERGIPDEDIPEVIRDMLAVLRDRRGDHV